MTLVIDASVVVAALVDNGGQGTWAEAILAQGELVAPELLVVEVSNVLRRLARSGSVSSEQADDAQAALIELPVKLAPLHPLLERIWELRDNVTAYDACYVAIAERLSAPLATLDRRLATQQTLCEFLTP
ncbi:MAG: type II toxin-antitoxin system VapC family toxin [Pseudomonadota bacterium]